LPVETAGVVTGVVVAGVDVGVEVAGVLVAGVLVAGCVAAFAVGTMGLEAAAEVADTGGVGLAGGVGFVFFAIATASEAFRGMFCAFPVLFANC
jgi:hypothetical protein